MADGKSSMEPHGIQGPNPDVAHSWGMPATAPSSDLEKEAVAHARNLLAARRRKVSSDRFVAEEALRALSERDEELARAIERLDDVLESWGGES